MKIAEFKNVAVITKYHKFTSLKHHKFLSHSLFMSDTQVDLSGFYVLGFIRLKPRCCLA